MPRANEPGPRPRSAHRIGMLLLGSIILSALLAPSSPPSVPMSSGRGRDPIPGPVHDLHRVFHPLGTDRLGRDVWARLVHGPGSRSWSACWEWRSRS